MIRKSTKYVATQMTIASTVTSATGSPAVNASAGPPERSRASHASVLASPQAAAATAATTRASPATCTAANARLTGWFAAGRRVLEVGPEQRQQAAQHQRPVAGDPAKRDQPGDALVDLEPAKHRDQVADDPRREHGQRRRGRQRQLVPVRPQGTEAARHGAPRPAPGRPPPAAATPITSASGSPTLAHASSAKTATGTHRAAARPVEQQEEQQQRHPGADVIGIAEQHPGRHPRLGREHDPRRRPAPGPPPRRPGAAAGDVRDQQHQQRVGDRGADVHHLRAKPGRGRSPAVLAAARW